MEVRLCLPILRWRTEREIPSRDNHLTALNHKSYNLDLKVYLRCRRLHTKINIVHTSGQTWGKVETGVLTLYISVLFLKI